MLTRRTFLGRMLAGAVVLGACGAGARASTSILRRHVREARLRRRPAAVRHDQPAQRYWPPARSSISSPTSLSPPRSGRERNGVGATVVSRLRRCRSWPGGTRSLDARPVPSPAPTSSGCATSLDGTRPVLVPPSSRDGRRGDVRQRSALPGHDRQPQTSSRRAWLRLTLLRAGPRTADQQQLRDAR
jgi:hypothetical protein